MREILNNSISVVDDMLKGYIKAHQKQVSTTTNPRVLKYARAPVSGKVGIVTGGGSATSPRLLDTLDATWLMQ